MAEIQIPTLNALISQVESLHPDADPVTRVMDAVVTARGLTDVADHLIGHFVDAARASGASWAQIGEALGVSKQAVQQRFVPKEPGTVADFENSFSFPSGGRFNRFTDRARNCVKSAEDVARAAGNSEVGPLHLLLGLFAEPEGLALRSMAELGANTVDIRLAAVDALPPSTGNPARKSITFLTEGRKALDLTVREALRLGHNYVGTEHLLLGLLADEQSPTAQILIAQGVTHQAVSVEVEKFLAAYLATRDKK